MGLVEKVYVEKISANDEEVILVSKYFQDGDYVKTGDTILDYETSKKIFQLCANACGFIKYLFDDMEIVRVGDVVVELYENAADISRDKTPDNYNKEEKNNVSQFSKAAIDLIEKYNINTKNFANLDLVTKYDVLKSINTSSDDRKDIHIDEMQSATGVWKSVSKSKSAENRRLQESQALTSSVFVYLDLPQNQMQSGIKNHIFI